MPHKIVCEECIICGACATECPSEAISEGKDCYAIDPGKCNDCGSCADICPQECIKGPDDKD
jgi:ferredoxin